MSDLVKQWFKKFFSCLSEILIAFAVIVGGYAVVLYYFKMLWKLYTETQVGSIFRDSNEIIFNAINTSMDQNLLVFSFSVSLLAAKICLVIALASQLFFLKRLFYDSRGFIGRIVLFGFPCTAVTAFSLQNTIVDVDFYFCLMPTLGLFGYCFKFAGYVVPGFDELMSEKNHR